MQYVYRGHEISVERDANAVSDSALFYSVFRECDGFELRSGVYYGEESIYEYYAYMKQAVDAAIEEGETFEGPCVRITKHDIVHYTRRLNRREPYAVARYGDGEWLCIFGSEGKNCDDHRYFPALGKELRDSLHNADLEHIILPVAWRVGRPAVMQWFKDQGLDDRDFYGGSPFLFASLDGQLRPFVEAIRDRRSAYVGPGHLVPIARALRCNAFAEVPPVNAYLSVDRLENDAVAAIQRAGVDDVVILLSAGMTANALVHRLQQRFAEYDNGLTLIDVGSIFDPYVGVISRSYAKGRDWRELWEKNLGPTPAASPCVA